MRENWHLVPLDEGAPHLGSDDVTSSRAAASAGLPRATSASCAHAQTPPSHHKRLRGGDPCTNPLLVESVWLAVPRVRQGLRPLDGGPALLGPPHRRRVAPSRSWCSPWAMLGDARSPGAGVDDVQ